MIDVSAFPVWTRYMGERAVVRINPRLALDNHRRLRISRSTILTSPHPNTFAMFAISFIDGQAATNAFPSTLDRQCSIPAC